MARDIYEKKQGGDAIQLWTDAESDKYIKADFQAEIDDLATLLNLDEDSKNIIRQALPVVTDAEGNAIDYFDDYLQGEWERLNDILEYFDYNSEIREINRYLFGWQTPETVETYPGEDSVDGHLLMIDGVNNTFWEWTSGSPPYVVEFKLRDWGKRVEGVRFRNTTGDARSSLLNVQVNTAMTLNGLDNSPNRFDTPFSMTLGLSGWQEFSFDNIASHARYIRLTIGATDHANDQIRIREIGLKVGTREY